jgi:hypothetical protein
VWTGYGNDGDIKNPGGYTWKRPSEMGGGYDSSPSLFGDHKKPIPNGINQQGLGDCWFLSATAAVAEDA